MEKELKVVVITNMMDNLNRVKEPKASSFGKNKDNNFNTKGSSTKTINSPIMVYLRNQLAHMKVNSKMVRRMVRVSMYTKTN